jgi:RNA recognition motif-containing protein
MSNNKLFVHGFRGYLSLDDRKTMIVNLFSKYGKIKLTLNPKTQKEEEVIIFIRDKDKEGIVYKNFCFVEMETDEDAQAVVAECANVEFEDGIKLSTSIAKAKDE